MTKLVPIFIPPEVKKIIELNKGLGKNDLGKSLVDLLEHSPKYKVLKEKVKEVIDISELNDFQIKLSDLKKEDDKGI